MLRDLILCYNLFHGICQIDLPFKLGASITCGNSCKLVKTSCNTNAAKHFYTNRIVLVWNSLSDTFYSTAYLFRIISFCFFFLHFILCRMCVCHMFNKVLTYLLTYLLL